MVFVQKVLPFSTRINIAVVLLLVAFGLWVAAVPPSMPALVSRHRSRLRGWRPKGRPAFDPVQIPGAVGGASVIPCACRQLWMIAIRIAGRGLHG